MLKRGYNNNIDLNYNDSSEIKQKDAFKCVSSCKLPNNYDSSKINDKISLEKHEVDTIHET